jgi:hypothetical protein
MCHASKLRGRTVLAAALALVSALALGAPALASSSSHPRKPPKSGHPPRLSVSGERILDPSGHRIVLRGFNWGQWGTALRRDAVANVEQGANSVRIPLRWWGDWKPGVDSLDLDAPGSIDRAHLALLDKTIRWASRKHLWIDFFVDSNNGQGAGGTDNFWTNETKRRQFFRMWEFLAARYKHTPYIGSLELLPEPRPPGVSDEAVASFYNSLIRTVRRVDPRIPLVVGPNDVYNAAHLDAAHTTVDSNVIYTANYFIFAKPLKQLPQLQAFESKYQAPVWVNQVGIPSGKPNSQESARTVLAALNDARIGWSWWTYRVLAKTPTTHGIYYLSSDADPHWILKADWLELVTSYF